MVMLKFTYKVLHFAFCFLCCFFFAVDLYGSGCPDIAEYITITCRGEDIMQIEIERIAFILASIL